MPQYPGGEDSLMVFLGRNMRYPVIAAENGIQGKVIVRFVVQKDGSIGDVEIVRSLDAACDKEVIPLLPHDCIVWQVSWQENNSNE